MIIQEKKKEVVERTKTTHVICDVCKKKYSIEDDELEIQEFLYIRNTGGYGSVFGDGTTFECDMCQHCQKKLFGDYINRRLS
jgi:hypothetical protein